MVRSFPCHGGRMEIDQARLSRLANAAAEMTGTPLYCGASKSLSPVTKYCGGGWVAMRSRNGRSRSSRSGVRVGCGSTNCASARTVARKFSRFTPARAKAGWSLGRCTTVSSSAKVTGLMTGIRRRCKTAWTIRAGGPTEDNRPDTKMFVSRTTRTIAPHRLDLGSNLAGRDA